MSSSVDRNFKFSELTFSTPAISKATSKLFSSQGCSDDKNCLYFSSIFFKICRFRSSILLSLSVFIPQGATLESSLTVAWFSWTNQNSFATHSNQWDCFICIDNRLRQMAFFVFVKVGGVRGKGRLSGHAERFWNKKAFLWKFVSLLYKTNRFHVAVRLFSNRSQKTSKCGKNISDTLGYRLVCHFFVLTTFWHHLWSITEQTHGNMESIC